MVKKKATLREFQWAKKRATCKVCNLPEKVRAQIRRQKYKEFAHLADVLEWLHAVHGVKITAREFKEHGWGRHDYSVGGSRHQ